MKQLIVDMDDVMGDFTGQLINYYEKEFCIKINRESLNGKEDIDGFPQIHHAIVRNFPHQTNFFRTLELKENSQEVLEKLNFRYKVFIVSAALKFPFSVVEKIEWLKEHFPFLSWEQLVFCGSKDVVFGDFMIDDNVFNLEKFNGEKFFFTAPHNIHIDRFHRLNNWREVADRLL
jgi:5'-nucleotidase